MAWYNSQNEEIVIHDISKWTDTNSVHLFCFPYPATFAEKDEKLQNLDEDTIEDIVNLVGDDNESAEREKLAKEKQAKARAQVERRLAAEQRKAEKSAKTNSGKKKGGDDNDDEDLAAFVKGSRAGKQKKR